MEFARIVGRMIFLNGVPLALLVACASGPPPVLLVLSSPGVSQVGATSESPAGGEAVVVELHSLSVPEYMTARRVRHRASSETVVEWPNTYWSERIEVGMLRVLAAELQAGQPQLVVCQQRCSAGEQPRWRVTVDFQRLDYHAAGGSLSASARVVIIEGTDQPPRGRVMAWSADVHGCAASPAGQAAAMSQALRELARAVRASVRADGVVQDDRRDCELAGGGVGGHREAGVRLVTFRCPPEPLQQAWEATLDTQDQGRASL